MTDQADLSTPPYLFMWATDHSGSDQLEECAVAIAPTSVPLDRVSRDAQQVLAHSAVVAQSTGHRLLFFSELSAFLINNGDSWEANNVDWEAALYELTNMPILRLMVSLSLKGFGVLSSAAKEFSIIYEDGIDIVDARTEQQRMREQLEAQLFSDWFAYVEQMKRNGALH